MRILPAVFILFTASLALGSVMEPVLPFVHPGISYSRADLELMRERVQGGIEPWASANAELRRQTPLDFEPRVFRHIISGPNSQPDSGGQELRASARTAHACALLWFITREEAYAEKARAILRAWDGGVWTFDENNTKLLAAQACDPFVNAAEILRHTWPRWEEADTALVTRLLMGTFYPVIRYYFPEANGNWDGANIRALLGIAIFTDNRDLFANAVRHYLFSSANGSIIKYVYPSGQCQESTRDQSHVQMGLGLFADAARIAWTQGVDLFGVADHRLALGFEYTSHYLLGGEPQAYGVISPEKREKLSSSYLHVVRHYHAQGVRMPHTEQIVDRHFREGRDFLSILTATRAGQATGAAGAKLELKPSRIAYPAGARPTVKDADHGNAILVRPGESVQAAVDRGAKEGRPVVALAGLHELTDTLLLPSRTTLRGEGRATIILGGKVAGPSAFGTRERNLADVTLENLVLEGAFTYGTEPENTARFRRTGKFANQRSGVILAGGAEGAFRRITLRDLTVNDFSRNGVLLSGIDGLTVERCDFSDNGSHVVPGPRLQHNLKLVRVRDVIVRDSRLDTSLKGAGLHLAHARGVRVLSCEVARNGWFGILAEECTDLTISGCLLEGNDAAAIHLAYQSQGSDQVSITGNTMQYNNGYALESYRTKRLHQADNRHVLNTLRPAQELISADPVLLLEEGLK